MQQFRDHYNSAVGPFKERDVVGAVDSGIDAILGGWVRHLAVPFVRALVTTTAATGTAATGALRDRLTRNQLAGQHPSDTNGANGKHFEKTY
jgi:hypothetical protein